MALRAMPIRFSEDELAVGKREAARRGVSFGELVRRAVRADVGLEAAAVRRGRSPKTGIAREVDPIPKARTAGKKGKWE